MVINIGQLTGEPIGTVWRYGFRQLVECLAHGEVTLLRTDKGVFVSGAIETTVETVCSRCLAPVDQKVSIHIGEEYSYDAEEEGFAISKDGDIDLSEAVRQYSVLATPMKPLCRKDCAGLCPTCGHNLNYGPCNCPRQEIDPRMAKLAMLVKARGGQE